MDTNKKKKTIANWAELEYASGKKIKISHIKNPKIRKALQTRTVRETGLGHLDHSQHQDLPT